MNNDNQSLDTAEYEQGKVDGYDAYGSGYMPQVLRTTAYLKGYYDGYLQAEQDDFQHLAHSMY